jgi:hypothetical protein
VIGVRRIFWVGLGAAAGVLVVRKVSKAAQAYTPDGIAQSLAGLGDGLREMADVVREAMSERDAELRLALGVDEGAIDPDRARALIERPVADLDEPGHRRAGPDAGAVDPGRHEADSGRAANPAHRAPGRAR